MAFLDTIEHVNRNENSWVCLANDNWNCWLVVVIVRVTRLLTMRTLCFFHSRSNIYTWWKQKVRMGKAKIIELYNITIATHTRRFIMKKRSERDKIESSLLINKVTKKWAYVTFDNPKNEYVNYFGKDRLIKIIMKLTRGKKFHKKRIITWHRTSIWVFGSKSIFVGFPDINLCPIVSATQYLDYMKENKNISHQ